MMNNQLLPLRSEILDEHINTASGLEAHLNKKHKSYANSTFNYIKMIKNKFQN